MSNWKVKKPLIIVNSMSFVITHILHVTVILWLQQYLLKRISVDEYSIYPVVASIMFFTPLIEAIFTTGIARYGVEAHATGDEKKIIEIVSSSLPFTILGGLLIFAIGLFISTYLSNFLNIPENLASDASLMVVLLFFQFSAGLAISPFSIGLHVKEKFVLHNIIRLIGEASSILILLILLFIVSTKVLWVVVATSVGSIVTLILKTYFSYRTLPSLKYKRLYFSPQIAKRILRFGGWNSLYVLAMALKNNTDVLVLNKLSTPLNVTCSYLGRLFQKQANIGWEFIRISMNPSLTALHSLGRDNSLKNAYIRGGRYSLWIVLLFAVPLIIFSKEIITLYVGKTFYPASIVMVLLLLTTPFEYGNIMIASLARARGEMKSIALRSLIAQITNVTLTIIVVYSTDLGAIGAAGVTACVALVFEPLVMWPLGFRLANVQFQDFMRYILKPGLIPSITTALFLIILKRLFIPDNWFTLLCCASTGMFVYALTVYFYCFEPVDKKDIQKLFQRFKQRNIFISIS